MEHKHTASMDAEGYPIWVNWERRIISFHQAEGFEMLLYPTHEQMLSFAVSKGYAGFAIQ